MSDELDDFLAHHGIKGMHWGVRKKDPSAGADTVSPEVTAKREAAAKKFDGRAATYQKRLDEIAASTTRNPFKKHSNKNEAKDLTKLKMTAVNDANAKRRGKLTSTQKKLIIGGVIVGAVAAASIISYNVESGNFRRSMEKGKLFLNGSNSAFDAFKKDSKLADKNLSIDDIQKLVVSKTNPDFGGIGTKQNCRRTTFAYELRRRGYDVTATKTTNANGQNTPGLINALSPQRRKQLPTSVPGLMATFIKEDTRYDARKTNFKPVQQLMNKFDTSGGKNAIRVDDYTPGISPSIFSRLSKEPEGSRGEVAVTWKPGGGHSMAYEIIKGVPYIIDNQSNKIFKTPAEFIDFQGGKDQVKESGFTRLDNAHINANYLLKWVKNAD